MNIGDIVLSKDVEKELLNKNGYISETILIKYPTSYSNEVKDDEWRYMNADIAYLDGKRPEWADDIPSILDVKDSLYNSVLQKIVEKKFVQFLLS